MPVNIITLTIEDAGGDLSPVSVYVAQDGLYTVEQLGEVFAHVLWDAVRPLVNGVLVGVSVSVGIDFSAWDNNTPSAISDVEEKATFVLRPCAGGRPVRVTLPTVKESIFTGSGAGKFVDVTNSDYVYFDYIMTNDETDDGINATDSHGLVLCQVLYGEQSFGKG